LRIHPYQSLRQGIHWLSFTLGHRPRRGIAVSALC
jgi:hypothetical protein